MTLLLSRKRQNLLLNTTNLTGAAWVFTNANAATDTTVGPDGLTLAFKVRDSNTTVAFHQIDQTVTGGMYGSVTIGMYIKDAERTASVFRILNGSLATIGNGTINMAANTFVTTNGRGAIIPLADNWHFVWLTAANATDNATFRLFPNISTSHAGTVNSGVYVHAPFMVRGARVPTQHVRRP